MTTYFECKCLDDICAELGFKVVPSIYGNQNEVTLKPAADRLPIYSRDADLASGSVSQCLQYLYGLRAGLNYAKYLGFKRDAAEAKYLKGEQARKEKHEKEQLFNMMKSDNYKKEPFKDLRIK